MYDFTRPADFERMYEDYFSRIYNYIFYRILHREQTEDLVSEIFLKVSVHVFKFDRRKASFNTWIFTIAQNTLTDFYRKRRVHLGLDHPEAETAATAEGSAEGEWLSSEERQELLKGLSLLEERTRTVLPLKYFAEFTNREIARQTGINESTVSTLCVRGLAKLQKILEAG